MSPGFRAFHVQPQPGNVTYASITVPTLSGYIQAAIEHRVGIGMRLTITVPASTFATVCLPRFGIASVSLVVDGSKRVGRVQRDYVCVDKIGSKSEPRRISRGWDELGADMS